MNIRSILIVLFTLTIANTQATTWAELNFIDQKKDIQTPKVSGSRAGNAVSAWTSNLNGEMRAYAASYTRVTGWGTGNLVSAASGNAIHATCTADNSGNGLAIWARQPNSTNTFVIQSSYMPVLTRAWSAGANISSTSQIANSPAFGFNTATGNGLAIWNNLSLGQVEASFFTAVGLSWSAPVTISDPAVDIRSIQLVVLSTGRAYAVWQEYNSNLDIYNLKARIYNGSTWLAITTFANVNSNVAKSNLASDDAGNALLTWYDTDTSTLRFSRCTAGSTTWSTPADIGSPHFAFGTSLAVNPANGNATLVCTTFNGLFEYTEAMNYTFSTNTWTAPVAISNLSTGYTKNPSVTMDSNGNPVAVWTRYNGSNFVIETSSFSSGTWSAPLTLSTATTKLMTPNISASNSTLLPVVHAVWDWYLPFNQSTTVQANQGSP